MTIAHSAQKLPYHALIHQRAAADDYALVLPALGRALSRPIRHFRRTGPRKVLVLSEHARAQERPGPYVYQQVHSAMVEALNQQNAGVCLEDHPPETPPGICFTRAEINDIVLEKTRTKVAGAAMKRNKKGLLFQGSIWKPFLPAVDWDLFAEAFPIALARLAEVETDYPGWPDFDPDEESALIDQYASSEWIEAR